MPPFSWFILGACLAAITLARWSTQAAVIWQMGRFDQSSAEFHPWIHPQTGDRQINYADPQSDADFRIGRSDPGSHWPAFQPGSANGGAGFRAHPARITFVLDERPERNPVLRIGLLTYSARLSILELHVNGRVGWFHQEPRLSYAAGDPAIFFQPHYATAEVAVELPAEWLRPGTNELILIARDVPGEREDVRPSGFPLPGSSGLIYDALALELPDAGITESPPVVVRVTPTVFFRERAGGLQEEVEVRLRFRGRVEPGTVELTMGQQSVSGSWSTRRDFGEEVVMLEVPAWTGTQEARLKIRAGNLTWEETVQLTAARRWTLSVVPHEHLDVGYTDYEAKVAELQARVVDDARELAEQHPPFCFTVDGFWVVEQYLAGRSATEQAKLIQAVKQGRIHIPAVHGSLFTGSASLEGLIRALYPSRRFSREHGTPFDTAIVTDVPSYSWSWASVLAASGVKYFVGASDAYRGPFLLHNRLHETSPHAWEGPDGGRVITWYARHYHQFSSLFGLPPRRVLGRDSLPRFLQAYDRPGYRSTEVLLYGTQVENVALDLQQATFVREWNEHYAYPRLGFSGFAAALDRIVAQQGTLPVVRGDGGPYWEDGLAANARITALARGNSRRLPSAEKLGTLVTGLNPRFQVDGRDLESAWQAGRLIDEHTWHADCSVRDPESEQAMRQGEAKDARAYEARRATERVVQRSLSALGDTLKVGPGSVLLFNPLSSARSAVVEMDLGRGQGLVDPATGESIPVEILRSGRVYQRVRFQAPEVPAMGYRSLRIRPLPVTSPKPPAEPNPVMDGRHYRIVLDPERGALRSLVELSTGREWVATQSPHAFGQWLSVRGGDVLPNRLVQYSTVSPVPELTIHPAASGRLEETRRSEAGWTARMTSQALGFPRIETEVHLPTARKEIWWTVRVKKEATRDKEAAYLAFPVAVPQPRFRFATANGWVDPARDILPGGSQEWFAVQDWVSVADAGRTFLMAPLDAPLVTLGDLVRGIWPVEFGERAATVYSYVMSNYTPEGYAAEQGGDFVFRYVFTTQSEFSAEQAARFGAESLTPLEVGEVTRSDQRSAGPGTTDSRGAAGLAVTPASVSVSAWKRAEDGRGEIIRLVETSGNHQRVQIALPGVRVRRAWLCSAVEDDQRELSVVNDQISTEVAGFGILTVRLERVPSGSP